MRERRGLTVLVAVVLCLSVCCVLFPAFGPVGDASAVTDDTRRFQMNGTDGSTRNDSAPSNASVTFENQTTTGTTVKIRSVTLPSGGFVAIHNSSYLPPENETVDSIIGVSGYLDAGKHENVTVVLENLLLANQTLIAVVHRDGNENKNFDYVTSNGFIDTAFGVNGTPVSDRAIITVQRIPSSRVGRNAFGDRPTSPSITVENQTLINDRITIDSVTLPTYSFIVVHNSSYNASSPSRATIIGRTQVVRVGKFQNITIELYDVPGRDFNRSEINGTERVYVSLYRDTNRNGEFDFQNMSQGTDVPYLNESGLPIVESVRISIGKTTEGRNATKTPETTTTVRTETVVSRQETTSGLGGEAGMEGEDNSAGGGGSGIIAGLLIIGGIIAVLAVGWVVVGRSRASDDHDVNALQQELARIRMAVSRSGIDMRAYGIPADWQTLEIELSENDSEERKDAFEAFATIEGLAVAPTDETAFENGDNGFTHRNATISLPRETIESVEAAAAEGDERSQEVIEALRRVLSAYHPDAVRATTDADGDA